MLTSAQPRNAERTIFDFGLNVKRGYRADLVVIRVTLPPAFPNTAPQAQVLTPGVRHPWIDSNGNITGCTSLYTWNPNNYNSRLERVVSDILAEFVASPPQVQSSNYPTQQQQQQQQQRPQSMQIPAATPYDANRPMSERNISRPMSERKPARSSSEDGVLIPPVPDTFPELDDMSYEELEKIQNDDKAFEEFFAALPMPTMTVEMRDQIITSNEKQARVNLGFKERIEKLQESALLLQEEALNHWKHFKQLETRQNAAMRQFDPLRLLTQLESSSNQLDDASEALATEFLDNDISLEDFLKREMDLRKLYHLRRAKAERFRQQLKKT
mmetsp:Transcript_26092/g.42141  ORF Transcript_26092/g.42141 Transcript_26092/m.42141 type:complete len:328 (-) Transcript_26092:1819-2802(-)